MSFPNIVRGNIAANEHNEFPFLTTENATAITVAIMRTALVADNTDFPADLLFIVASAVGDQVTMSAAAVRHTIENKVGCRRSLRDLLPPASRLRLRIEGGERATVNDWLCDVHHTIGQSWVD